MQFNIDKTGALVSATSLADGFSRFYARATVTSLLLFLMLPLTSCKSLTVMCVEQSQAQYNTAVKQYGKENVQQWRLTNATPNPYPFHAQTRVRINGTWYWLPNKPVTEYFETKPQEGCTPFERIK